MNGTLEQDLASIKEVEDTLTANRVSRFAYTEEAYISNHAEGVEVYNVDNDQNIPKGTASVMKVNQTVIDKGYRAQASSVTRMFLNHFFGRLSYNLNKINDNMSNLLSTFQSHLGTVNGLATLDENGRIPYSQLPESVIEYKGAWDAGTNTPHLENGTGTKGDFYVCSVAGTVDFGNGAIIFEKNDRVIYDGEVWQKLGAGAVSSVNGKTGTVVINSTDIEISDDDNRKVSEVIATLSNGATATMTLEGDVLTITIPE